MPPHAVLREGGRDKPTTPTGTAGLPKPFLQERLLSLSQRPFFLPLLELLFWVGGGTVWTVALL